VIGSDTMDAVPSSRMTIEMTDEKIGRLMKKFLAT
jgi:hypothetical protein